MLDFFQSHAEAEENAHRNNRTTTPGVPSGSAASTSSLGETRTRRPSSHFTNVISTSRDLSHLFTPLVGTICLVYSLAVQSRLQREKLVVIKQKKSMAPTASQEASLDANQEYLDPLQSTREDDLMPPSQPLTPKPNIDLSHLSIDLTEPASNESFSSPANASAFFLSGQSETESGGFLGGQLVHSGHFPGGPDDESFLQHFLERHRNIVNKIVRRMRHSLLTLPFCVLFHFPRVLDFDVKCAFFHQCLGSSPHNVLHSGGTERLVLSRSRLFEDSYSRLHRKPPQTWKKRFVISFKSEYRHDTLMDVILYFIFCIHLKTKKVKMLVVSFESGMN
jgi:hypothetical protein